MGCCSSKNKELAAARPHRPNPPPNDAIIDKLKLETAESLEKNEDFFNRATAAEEENKKEGQVVEQRPAAVRSSSCTKEELDAILIQCGRLSRNSSNKDASRDARKYHRSNWSFDFDDEEKPALRRSPCRTPGGGRSGSRERGSGGGRRTSRSPGRSRLPAKLVSVPPKEDTGAINARRSLSLSRSSSRKAEQSRNPMAEINDNYLPKEQPSLRKPTHLQSQKAKSEVLNGLKSNNVFNDCVRAQLMSCRVKDEQQQLKMTVEATVVEPEALKSISEAPKTIRRTQPSRKFSRDLDHSYLLGDININHNNSFSLPACVSKASSIIDAVADLNSTSSEQRRFSDKEPLLESEIFVKDDIIEPSLHKYVSLIDLEGESELRESAGSNSFTSHRWSSSSWEPNSIDPTTISDVRQRRSQDGSFSSNSIPTALRKREFGRQGGPGSAFVSVTAAGS